MPSPQNSAQALAFARFDRVRLTGLPEALTHHEAYDAGELVVEQWVGRYGGSVIGYKIACTNPSAQQYLNLDTPFYGRLLSASTFNSPARMSAQDFFMRVIEPEFAFRMARTPANPSREAIADAIEGVIPGIEIVDSRYTSWTTMGAAALIADNACHGAWVKGALLSHWRDIDLAAQQVELVVNGKLIGTGSGAAVLGHPLNAMEWLAHKLAERGIELKAGDYVTTGVTTDTYMAEAGDRVYADFGPVGSVALMFESH